MASRYDNPHTTALTANAVLVVTHNSRGGSGLAAFDRADGKSLWELKLPANPIQNGLAVAANGRIVLALRNGDVICVGEREQETQ